MVESYLDHNATTPLDPRVRDAMLPWLGDKFGNASSVHRFGQSARDAVERAREQVAILIDATPAEIVFTASATEANNAVIRSSIREVGSSAHLAVSAMDHPSVSSVAEDLESSGIEISWIETDPNGVMQVDAVATALRPDTALVCVALANNIIGTIQPVEKISALCHEHQIAVLCDAVQAIGKIPVSVGELGVDLLTIGAHKFYGPLGAAALWIRKGFGFRPFVLGGSQERQRRAGTVNVPAVVGMGKASELAHLELEDRRSHLLKLQGRLEQGLGAIEGTVIHGQEADRLPNTTHVAFDGVDGQSLLIRLDLEGFAVSAGSACSSGTIEPSRVLLAMGIDPQEAASALRISLGHSNTEQEIDRFLEVLEVQLIELRRLGAVTSA